MPSARFLAALILCLPLLQAAQPVRARKAMVVSREPHATDAGLDVLKAGGNAVDAAVTVGLALAVTHPWAGNIGGGGFMLIRLAGGQTTFIDFRERAPQSSTRNLYLNIFGAPTSDSTLGWRAPGVPGTVRGFELAHKRYGRAQWQNLVAPAIRLARVGFPVSWGLADTLRTNKKLPQFPESKRIFLNNGEFFTAGDLLRQPDLASTLERIAANASDFYEGETARRFAAEMAKHGGEITLADLNKYAAVERKVLEGSYRGYTIYTAPPPSAGGIGLLHMLGVLEGSGYDKGGAGSAASIHFVAETMRRYYADRSEYIADPDFHPVPVKQLLDSRYIESRRRSIDPERATPSDAIKPGDLKSYESSETTHYSIVDEEGNAVAVTYTLNNGFGSGATVPGLGFLLNDEMDDFSVKPGHPNSFGLVQGERNRIEPGKRPLSNMTPTILVKDGKLYMVTGTPGGARIINAVLQSIINVVDFQMNMQDAVDWPRFHHQWRPDRIEVEPGISPDTRALLAGRGHTVELIRNFCELAAIRVEGGWLEGAADHRVEGKAAGY